MTVTAPGRSKVLAPSSARLSRSVRGASAAAAIPIGTLTNSTQRQLRPLVRIPPRSTPAAPPAPTTAPQIAQCPVALGALGKGHRDDRQRRRRHDRGAEALGCPRREQPSLRLRDPARERGEREQHQSEHEHPAAPEQVGHAAAEQQEAAEGQRVGVDDPRKIGPREVKGPADRRQRDVHDRGVDHDDELRHREQQQGEILPAGRIERRCLRGAYRCHWKLTSGSVCTSDYSEL